MSTAPKIAVVTGAGSGIGRQAALALAADGLALVLAGRRPEALEATAALIRAATPGADVLCVPTDVTDEQQVDALFDAAVARHGRVDVLFNNAGTNQPAVPIDELSVAQWRAVVDVNLNGAFLCARAAFRTMRRQSPAGGRIINNGSISSHVPRPYSVSYTATKHAILGLTRSLALDGRTWNIACSQIDIGNAATDMTERMAQGVLQANLVRAPEPRMDVAEVGRAVAYMASLPPEANVLNMTLMATQMPFVGRG